MSIDSYFDTSALLKIYNEELGSLQVTMIAQLEPAIPLLFVVEIELRNSLRVLHGRGRILLHELQHAFECIDQDIANGRLLRQNQDAMQVERTSFSLSEKYTSACLSRSLDIIHVATAIIQGSMTFVTCDKRQALLAEKAGLEVNFIDLSQIA